MATKRKIGVFVCHCGGNISDYVKVDEVVKAVENDPGVAVAKTHMFTCSDASQQLMIDDIKENQLDGVVIASCSPKLHMFTFRGMSERAGLNPYQYVHVNLREQCSWAHTDDKIGATEKGIHLVRAGIAKCLLTKPLNAIRVETQPRVLVIGAGAAGMRASLLLADMGLTVYLIEKAEKPGGWALETEYMGPEGQYGPDVAASLEKRVRDHQNIMLYTKAELQSKAGSIGNFDCKITADSEEISLNVGAIVVTTGFDTYTPRDGEYGWGTEGVVDLKTFRQMMTKGELTRNGKPVKDVVFIYCVGSRQTAGEGCENPNTYCSRYCCTAAINAALAAKRFGVRSYHVYRDIRTYGKYETYYEEAGKNGMLFFRFTPDSPPVVEQEGDKLVVRVKDQLTFGEEVEIPADLVVLVTGMELADSELYGMLKIPFSRDGFLQEVHPKLRPVETAIGGVLIAGTSQAPKDVLETSASASAAAAKAATYLLKGYTEIDPFVVEIDAEKCNGCEECVAECPSDAISMVESDGKRVAKVNEVLCRGCGACAGICPVEAINLRGYYYDQLRHMIDSISER